MTTDQLRYENDGLKQRRPADGGERPSLPATDPLSAAELASLRFQPLSLDRE